MDEVGAAQYRARMTTSFKLYYTPTSCGAANFLAAHIGGLTFDSEIVDLRAHKTASGADFYAINPKGNVPTLAFSDGTILNENVATLTYLADAGSAGLAPKEGSLARYRYLNDLGFVASELHPAFGALFNPTLSDEAKERAIANVGARLSKLEKLLGKNHFFNGSSLSTVDLYAYIVLSWSPMLKVTLPPAVQAYFEGLDKHEAIIAARAAMAAR